MRTSQNVTKREHAEEELAESEARYRTLAESSPLAILVNRKGKVFLANPACAKLFGASSPKELIGKSALDLFHPDSRGLVRERIREDSETVPLVEVKIVRLDGTSVDVEATASPFLDQGVKAVQVLLRDVTERKQAEEELAESEARYRTLAERSPLAVFVSRNGKDNDEIILANEACVELFGVSSPEELVGKSALGLFHPDSQALVRGPLRVGTRGTLPFIEAQIVRLDGASVEVDVSAAPLLDEGLPATQVLLRDITEAKRAEQALRQSEEKYATAFHASPDSITITRVSDGKIVEVNEGFERLLGYSRAESVGKTTAELSTYVDPGTRRDLVTRLQETGEVKDFDATLRRKDGTLVSVILGARILDFHGEECFLAVVHDVTERMKAEEERRRAGRFFQDTFEHADVGIAHVNSADGTWLRVNQRLCDLLGYTREELLRTTFAALTHPDDVEENVRHLRRLLAGDEDTYAADKRYLRRDGSTVWVHMNVALIRKEDGTPDYNITVLTDITDRKQAEEEIVRQKESIDRTLTSVIDIAGDIVELRDPYTAGHQRRVAQLATRLAQDLGMSDPEIADIRVAGLLHDMGKAGVPVEILSKPGAISPQELTLIKGHAEAGYRIAVAANMSESIAEMIYEHHERGDGSGYPRGLVGDQIVPGARVLAVADVVEAMMSHRPYRPAVGMKAALAEIERGAGSLYDADTARSCARVFTAGGFEFL